MLVRNILYTPDHVTMRGWINAKYMLRSKLPSNRLVTCFIANMAFYILQFTCCMWFFHVRCSLMQILFNGLTFIRIFILSRSHRLCFSLMTIYLVSLALSDNLLAQNHLYSLFISSFTIPNKDIKLWSDIWSCVICKRKDTTFTWFVNIIDIKQE